MKQACNMNFTQVVNTLIPWIWNLYLYVLHRHLSLSPFYAVYSFSTDLFCICIVLFPSWLFSKLSHIFLSISWHWVLLPTQKRIFLLLPLSLPVSVLLSVIGHSSHFRTYFLHLPQNWPYLMRAVYGSKAFKNLPLPLSFSYLLLLSLNCSVIWNLDRKSVV